MLVISSKPQACLASFVQSNALHASTKTFSAPETERDKLTRKQGLTHRLQPQKVSSEMEFTSFSPRHQNNSFIFRDGQANFDARAAFRGYFNVRNIGIIEGRTGAKGTSLSMATVKHKLF